MYLWTRYSIPCFLTLNVIGRSSVMTRDGRMLYVSLILPAYLSSTEGPLDVEEQQYELADDSSSGNGVGNLIPYTDLNFT